MKVTIDEFLMAAYGGEKTRYYNVLGRVRFYSYQYVLQRHLYKKVERINLHTFKLENETFSSSKVTRKCKARFSIKTLLKASETLPSPEEMEKDEVWIDYSKKPFLEKIIYELKKKCRKTDSFPFTFWAYFLLCVFYLLNIFFAGFCGLIFFGAGFLLNSPTLSLPGLWELAFYFPGCFGRASSSFAFLEPIKSRPFKFSISREKIRQGNS